MASILLHDASSGDKVQVNADRILYATSGQPYGHEGSRVFMDNERLTLDVRETPAEINKAINHALESIHSPDSENLKREARAEMQKALEGLKKRNASADIPPPRLP